MNLYNLKQISESFIATNAHTYVKCQRISSKWKKREKNVRIMLFTVIYYIPILNVWQIIQKHNTPNRYNVMALVNCTETEKKVSYYWLPRKINFSGNNKNNTWTHITCYNLFFTYVRTSLNIFIGVYCLVLLLCWCYLDLMSSNNHRV